MFYSNETKMSTYEEYNSVKPAGQKLMLFSKCNMYAMTS